MGFEQQERALATLLVAARRSLLQQAKMQERQRYWQGHQTLLLMDTSHQCYCKHSRSLQLGSPIRRCQSGDENGHVARHQRSQAHADMIPPAYVFRCPVCKQTAPRSDNCRRHLKLKHPGKSGMKPRKVAVGS